VGTGFSQKSCANKKLQQNADSVLLHFAVTVSPSVFTPQIRARRLTQTGETNSFNRLMLAPCQVS
jgi:hypothetical protein